MPGSGTGLDQETKPGEAPCPETQHGWFISKHSLQPLPKPWEEQNTDKLFKMADARRNPNQGEKLLLGQGDPHGARVVQPPLREPVALRGRGGTRRGAGVAFVLSLRHWGPPLSATPGSARPWLLPGQCRSSGRPSRAGQGVSASTGPAAISGYPGVTVQSHCAAWMCHPVCSAGMPALLKPHQRDGKEICWTAEASLAGPSQVGL